MQVPRKRPDVGTSRKKLTGGGSLQNGVTPKKARKLRAGLLALVVALAMVVAIPGFAQGIVDGVRAAFGVETLAGEGKWASDPDTHDDWYSGENGVSSGDNAEDSTRNTGRIWTDKSVYTSDVELTSQSGETTFEIKNDEGTALVGLSALSSAANISGQTTINQPLDIVLVLDRSGSMTQGYLTSYEYHEAYNPSEDRYDDTRYYALNDDGSYTEIEERRSGGIFGNRDFDGWYLNGDRVFPKTSANDDDASHIQFYTRTQTSTRIDRAMESAVSNFIDTVAEENAGKSSEQQHRVSIVSYSGDADAYSVGNGRDRQYFVNCTQGSNANGLKGYVTGLSYSGGTEAETGFREARNIINGTDGMGDGARPEAKKVVVFFTDGMPGDGDYVENDNAGQSVNIAQEMKAAGVSIYSVGVFQGADPSDLSGQGNREHDANYFMNAVSSNYPNASSRNTNSNWVDFSDNCTLGDRAEGNYYFAADNADALNDVFQSIYDDFGSGATSPIESNDSIGGEPVGYLTFTDTLGDYTEVKNFKSIVFAGEEFTQVSATPSGDGSTTTYVFQGSVDNGNDEGVVYPGSHNLSDIEITVTHGTTMQQGDTVEVQIPSTMLPMRLYTAESNTVDGETTTTTDVLPAYPIRVYYTVGLKNDLVDAEGNLDASQIDGGYIESHTDAETGNVYFYSNDYDGNNVGTTTASFTPATTNSFYYFTADTPLYTSKSTDNPARDYRPGNTYYYQRTYYANDTMQTEWVSIVAAENQLDSYVKAADDGNYYIEQGSPRLTRATEFEAAKDENTTGTATNSISPAWNGDRVVVTLGNNGKIAYPVSGDLQISKTVDWGTTGAEHNDKEFTYTVDLGNANNGGAADVQGNFDYIKYNAQGQPVDVDGNPQQVTEGAEPAATGQITDGGTLTLKNGERVVVKGLPSDTKFTVTENAEAGYNAANTVDGAASADGRIATGTIASSDMIAVAYTNTYNVTPTSLADGSLHGTKVLTGRDWKDGESFTFTLSAVTPNAPMPDEESVTLANTDQANYTENQKVLFDFGEIEYFSVGKYVYLIRETKGTESGLNYSSAAYRVTVNVTDDGAGNLTASIESMYRTFNDDGASTGENESQWPSIDDGNALFTNKFLGNDVAIANITGTKSFTDYTSGTTLDINDFRFTIAAVTQGAPMPAQTEVGNNGAGGITFADIQFGIDDIGNTYEYAIREVIPAGAADNGNGTSTLNGMTYDNTVKTVSIAVTQDRSTGSVVATVNGNDFVFTNSYRASSVTTEGAADGLQITKQLDGAAGAEGQFKFTMVAANNETRDAIANGSVTGIDADGNVKTSPAIAKDGSADILFDNLTFTRPGIYTFNVTETQDAPSRAWTYDGHTYQVAFEVTDENGQLVIADPVTTSGSATFVNRYAASMNYDNEAGGVIFSKTLNGHALAANQFNFTVTAPDGDTASADKLAGATTTLANRYGAANGVAALWRGIAGLTFDQDDAGQTFTFIVSEANGGAKGYTYDAQPVTVEIAVSDDGDGTLSTVTTVTKGDSTTEYKSADFVRGDAATYPTAAFVNTYTYTPATLVKDAESGIGVQKTVTGAPNSEDFTFTAAFNADDSKGTATDIDGLVDGKLTATISEDFAAGDTKAADFGTVTFKEPGTYVFDVSEDNTTTASGWTYDDNTRQIVVTVTDNNEGALVASVDGNDPLFTNAYVPNGVTVGDDEADLQVTKDVTGAAAVSEFDFTLQLTSDNAGNVQGLGENNSITKSTTGLTGKEDSETVDFGDLTFTAVGDYTFTVTETNQAPENTSWTYDNSPKTITIHVTDDGNDGQLDAAFDETNGNNPTIVNSYKATGDLPGDAEGVKDLTVSKEIDGRAWQEGDSFTFKLEQSENNPGGVTLPENASGLVIAYDENAEDQNAAYSDSFGNITFTLPGTYTFTVSEVQPAVDTDTEGVTYDTTVYTVNVEVTDAGEGVLNAEITSIDDQDGNSSEALNFTNTYEPGGSTDLPDEGQGSIQLRKVLQGKAWDGDAFTFEIAAADEASSKYMPAETQVTVDAKTGTDENGNDFADFGFGTITYDQIGVYTYMVTEVTSDNAGITYDSHTAKVTVQVSDNLHGGLTAAVTNIENGVFTNIYNSGEVNYDALGGLQIQKNLTGHDIAAGQFEFTVDPENENALEKLGAAKVVQSTAAQLVGNTATETLPVVTDMAFTKDDAGKDFEFTVAETKGGAEGYKNDDHVYNVVISVSDSGSGTLTVETRVDGLLVATYTASAAQTLDVQPVTLTFNNSYDAGSTTVGGESDVRFDATKTLTGRDMVADEFDFIVTDVKGNEVATGSNGAAADGQAGTVTFSPIEYTTQSLNEAVANGIAQIHRNDDGTVTYEFVYTVSEDTAQNDKGVTAVNDSFQVTVNVVDDGKGSLTATVNDDAVLAFTNTYGADAKAEVALSGNKVIALDDNTLEGPSLADIEGAFTFTLTGSEGAPMPEAASVKNDAQGNVSFGTIVYTMENVFGGESTDDTEGVDAQSAQRQKTFTYTVTESGTYAGITNDTGTKTVTVTVTDNGDGTISVAKTSDEGSVAGDFTFTNAYGTDPVPSAPTDPTHGGVSIKKSLTGRNLNEGEFTFMLRGASAPGVADPKGIVFTASNAADGSVNFPEVTFTQPGEYLFVITEVNGGLGGVTYDGSVYNALATVTDNQDGTLSVAWKITDADGNEVESITFENGYEIVNPGSIVFGASKKLDGRELADGEFTFELKDADGNVLQTATNAADGSVVFDDPVMYTEAGEYTYTVSEKLPEDDDQSTDGIQKDNVTYDETVYTATVTVTDNGDGSTSASVSYGNDGELPSFTNTYVKPAEPAPEEPTDAMPKTGDTSNVAVIGLGLAAMALVAGGVVLRRRTNR